MLETLLICILSFFQFIFETIDNNTPATKNFLKTVQPQIEYSQLAELKIPRTNFSVIQNQNNNLLFIGNTNSFEFYDANKNQMTILNTNCPFDLYNNEPYLTDNNNILIFSQNGIVEFNQETSDCNLKTKIDNTHTLKTIKIDNNNYLLVKTKSLKNENIQSLSLYNSKSNNVKNIKEIKQNDLLWSGVLTKIGDDQIFIHNNNQTESLGEIYNLKTHKLTSVTPQNIKNLDINSPILFERKLYNNNSKTFINFDELINNKWKPIIVKDNFVYFSRLKSSTNKTVTEFGKLNIETENFERLGYIPYMINPKYTYYLNKNKLLFVTRGKYGDVEHEAVFNNILIDL